MTKEEFEKRKAELRTKVIGSLESLTNSSIKLSNSLQRLLEKSKTPEATPYVEEIESIFKQSISSFEKASNCFKGESKEWDEKNLLEALSNINGDSETGRQYLVNLLKNYQNKSGTINTAEWVKDVLNKKFPAPVS